MAQRKILIIEDDANIRELLKIYLEREGYEITTADTGDSGIKAFKRENPDLVLLDIMLPETDGFSVCRQIRESSRTPIIMLTAKSETFDKIMGLELGADDYIVKPFEMREVLARISAVLRRYINGKKIDAPPKEIELLYFLASSPNRVFTRAQLLDDVWGFDYYGDTRTVDVHIKRLREKLDGASSQWELKTVWGVGYKFEVKENRPQK